MNPPAPAPPDIVRTKIVATLGPASRAEEAIRGLVEAGVDVFRLNMAHGSVEEHAESLERIRRVSDALARPVGVLADLAGPKIRLGELPGGSVELVEGEHVTFIRGSEPGGPGEFTVTYAPLVDELSPGDSVMLADGTISLVVTERNADHVRCRVVQGGTVRSRQGVNLPGVRLSVAAMSAADWQHAEWAAAPILSACRSSARRSRSSCSRSCFALAAPRPRWWPRSRSGRRSTTSSRSSKRPTR